MKDPNFAGVLERLDLVAKEGWMQLAGQLGMDSQPEKGDIDGFAEVLGRYLKHLTGPGRAVTLARHAIHTEAALRLELQRLVVEANENLAAWGGGVPAPARFTRPNTRLLGPHGAGGRPDGSPTRRSRSGVRPHFSDPDPAARPACLTIAVRSSAGSAAGVPSKSTFAFCREVA